jgi:hypothetical protein
MRGHHRQYIDRVNAMTPLAYFRFAGDRKVTVIRTLEFQTAFGIEQVNAGMQSDLFTCVPDTSYKRFHLASILHDHARRTRSRHCADAMFAGEMAAAITDIVRMLRQTDCPAKVIEREALRLHRVASLYTLGVSGLVGSVYIWFDKIF